MIERIGSCDHILWITQQDFVQEITGLWVDADMTKGGEGQHVPSSDIHLTNVDF